MTAASYYYYRSPLYLSGLSMLLPSSSLLPRIQNLLASVLAEAIAHDAEQLPDA
jgi:hypothetical protein